MTHPLAFKYGFGNKNKLGLFCIALSLHYVDDFVLESRRHFGNKNKLGLFCIALSLHYLCRLI